MPEEQVFASGLREEAIPLFPAGVVKRYLNQDHRAIDINDLEFFPNQGSQSESTDRKLKILELPRFKNLSAHINRCIEDYLDNVVCYQYEGYSVIHSWVNRTPDDGYQRMHFHGNSVISGCYYLKANQQSAPLSFEKSEMNTNPYIAIAPRKSNMFNANRMTFAVDSGLCYLFPSNILHGYETKNQGGERVSLAFNVMLGGIGGFYKLP